MKLDLAAKLTVELANEMIKIDGHFNEKELTKPQCGAVSAAIVWLLETIEKEGINDVYGPMALNLLKARQARAKHGKIDGMKVKKAVEQAIENMKR